jgi:hypothetical protein
MFSLAEADEWHAGLEKNSRSKLVLATLSKVPEIIRLPPLNVAVVIIG